MLRRLRRQADPGTPAADQPAAMTETKSFGANPGGLRMLSFIPESLAASAALVVVLHGCTQAAEAFASDSGWLTLAARQGFAVLAPEQVAANNPNRCFNWYQPGDTARGQGEAASIAAMVEALATKHGLDRSRIFVTGLSAGGAMAAAMLASYPDLFAGGAIIAGLPFGVAKGLPDALRVMQGGSGLSGEQLGALVRRAAGRTGRLPRVSIWHGEADHMVSPVNGRESAAQWAAAHGLSEQPDALSKGAGRSLAVWRGRGEHPAVELHQIAGLAHGTPLSTRGEDGLGARAAYMLEAGVSSTREMAVAWGLAGAEAATAPNPAPALLDDDAAPAGPRPAGSRAAEGPASHPGGGLGDQVMASLARHVPEGVQSVIAKALRDAGLMR